MNPTGLFARGPAAFRGWRWATRELAELRRTLGPDGLTAVVAPPPTVARGSLRGTLVALSARKATCLERSLVIQAWIAANGLDLDVIVAVKRDPNAPGDLAHAWVDGYDADCSARYAEIRRVRAGRVAPQRGT